ncbi:hypothetical protein GCK32_008997 [Trichostrongylus colubriformis]|uniref:Uncharacterized protein n=1 Tax=Trichostrongylus colubriformis TaxID=6319 RepID=A0AAN8FIZ2_TRICO
MGSYIKVKVEVVVRSISLVSMRNEVLLLTLHVLPVLMTNSKNNDDNRIKGFQEHNSRSGLPTLKPPSSTKATVPQTGNSSPSSLSSFSTEKSLMSKQDRNHRALLAKPTDLEVDASLTHSGTTNMQPSPAFAGGPNVFYKLSPRSVRLPRNAPRKPNFHTKVAPTPKKKFDKHVPPKKPKKHKATRKPTIRKKKPSHQPAQHRKTKRPAKAAKPRVTKPPLKHTKPKKTKHPPKPTKHKMTKPSPKPGVKTASPKRTAPPRTKSPPKPTKAKPSAQPPSSPITKFFTRSSHFPITTPPPTTPIPVPPSASTSSESSVQFTDSLSSESMALSTTHGLDATMEGDINFDKSIRRKPQRGNKTKRKTGTLLVIILVAAGILALLVAVAAGFTAALYQRRRRKRKRSGMKREILTKRPRRMESADIYATKFAHGGPLVLDAKLRGPVQHASENQSKSQSLQSLKFDPHLNEIVDIGSNVEVVDTADGTRTTRTTTAEEPNCEKGKSVGKSLKQSSKRKKANKDRAGVTPKNASPSPDEKNAKTAKGIPRNTVKSYSLATGF